MSEENNFSINAVTNGNRLIIQYTGEVFKCSPAIVNKDSNSVRVTETDNGFLMELDLKNAGDLNFSISSLGNNKEDNDLLVVRNNSIIKTKAKFGNSIYDWTLKLKKAVYKLFVTLPKIVTGNYKRAYGSKFVK